jgi:hypothetical protein
VRANVPPVSHWPAAIGNRAFTPNPAAMALDLTFRLHPWRDMADAERPGGADGNPGSLLRDRPGATGENLRWSAARRRCSVQVEACLLARHVSGRRVAVHSQRCGARPKKGSVRHARSSAAVEAHRPDWGDGRHRRRGGRFGRRESRCLAGRPKGRGIGLPAGRDRPASRHQPGPALFAPALQARGRIAGQSRVLIP